MTPEQDEKRQVAIEVLKRVISCLKPEQEDGETLYRDNGDFIIQLNEVDFNRLLSVTDDLETLELEY